MPKKIDRCVKKVKKKGMSEKSAWGICNKSLGKANKTKKQGRKR